MGLEKLLYLRGVGAEFTDCFGQEIHISEVDRQGILTCMLQEKNTVAGTAIDASATEALSSDAGLTNVDAVLTEALIASQIDLLDARPWTQVLPEFHWCFVDEPWISLCLPETYTSDLSVAIECEQGESIVFDVPFSALKSIGDYRIEKTLYLHYRLDLTQLGLARLDLAEAKTQASPEHSMPAETEAVNLASYFLSSQEFTNNPALIKNQDSFAHVADKNASDFSVLGLGFHRIALSLKHALETSAPAPSSALQSCVTAEADTSTLFSGTLMVAPRAAYQGVLTAVAQGKRHKPWGISVQLYSLRSESQWGIGDFGDLEQLIVLVAAQGADFIQLNPLHALDIAAPEHPSPYSPCDRRRLNPLYIQLQSVPEYQTLATEFSSASWLEAIALLNRDNWLDYPKVSELKYRAFEQLYRVFCETHLANDTPRAQRFHEFVREQGTALQEFAQAEYLRSPKAFVQEEGFYLYLQFVAENQLHLCQLKAKEVGMGLGLIRDLAVGAALQGSEVQANAEQFCLHASIGAPPDPFAPQGQNWGLTPLDPVKLKQHNFSHFISLIRANMESCGALRIDHVMGLLRLWWWPLDKQLGHGAYVYYPVETMLAIVCLESQRARCVVIGEDLGLVPPDIIHRLYTSGIYSNELFYFCKDHQGFKSPDQYKSQSLMMLANHDVPTLVAWWCGSDLHLRRQLSLFDSDEQLGEALAGREHEKQQLISLLVAQGLLAEVTIAELDIQTLLTAWMTLGARGNSALYSVQLCDLLADRHAVNIPGTWLEYPNWQRRLPLSLTQVSASPEILQRLQNIAAARQLPS
ncbi:4-alpha-glucanotransferase [Shewanella baltica]|uniref:4-alpha-glucanotransferase n=1 Tax=Shewanella baltica TaxID=62322 RepID=UPI003D7B358F